MDQGNRVYCLYRVSTAKQVDHDEFNQADIPMQRIACHEFAIQMGWTIVRKEQENGVSGFKVSASDRDKIQLIKEHAQQNKFDILLVFMFDRIGRIASETPFIVEWFVQHGIQVWSVKEGEQRFDSHVDRLTNFIRYWQADGESQKTSMRVKEKRKQMTLDGLYGGGGIPYGFKLESTGLKNKRKMDLYTFAVDEDEAEIVRMMYAKCVNEGLGQWSLATYLNGLGLKNREGKRWSHCMVGRILKSECYIGIMKAGETKSKQNPKLQIVDNDTYARAQKLIEERTNKCKDTRTMPLNTRGMSLMSGNVFCGHCGARLTLTTNGKVYTRRDGVRKKRPRIRYVCFGKTRHRELCDGQTGYTMYKLDGIIEIVIKDIFSRMKSVSESETLARCNDSLKNELTAQFNIATGDYAKAAKELDALQGELVRVVMGQSDLPRDFLTKTITETQTRYRTSKELADRLQAELDERDSHFEMLKGKYEKLLDWSEMFDNAEMAVKKMIAAYMIERVDVFRDYKLNITLNMDIRQFTDGLGSMGLDTIKESPAAETAEP